jgi:ABC-type sugar transport system permease subunit
MLAPSAAGARTRYERFTVRWSNVLRSGTPFGRRLKAGLFMLPGVVLVVGLFWYALVFTVYVSFTQWSGLEPQTWIGLGNYSHLLSDPETRTALANTGYWVIGSLLLPVGLGLVAAVMLQNLRGQVFFKNVFYLPYAIGLTATAVIWGFLMGGQGGGGISQALRAIGLTHLANTQWLFRPPVNTFSMIVASTWQVMGTDLLLFLVGLGALDRSVFEAAALDGATGLTLLRKVTLPLLRPMLTVVITITIVNSLQAFNVIWVLTQGGPFGSSNTLATWLYQEGFSQYSMGYASAIAVVLTVLVVALSSGYLRRTLRVTE